MSLPEERLRQSQPLTSLYLSNIEIGNFGGFRNKNFEFHRGLNFIDGNNGAGKATILKAIEVLLWPIHSENTCDLRTLTRSLAVASRSGNLPSTITGYFQEFDKDLTPTGPQHSLCVRMRATNGRSAVRFLWDEDLKSITQVRETFAEYGLNQASVFSVSEDKIASADLVPMEFFRTKLDKIPLVNEVKKNAEMIEALTQKLLGELELYSFSSTACQSAKRKIRNLSSPDSGNAELFIRQEELEELARYSKQRGIESEARRLEKTIQKYRKRLERQEKKYRAKEAERLASVGALDPVLAEIPSDSTCRMPDEVLDRLKQELNQRRAELAEISERFVSWESSEDEQRSLTRTIEREKREFVVQDRNLIKALINKSAHEERLRILQNSSGTGMDTKCFQSILEQGIEFLEHERAIMRDGRRKLEEILQKQQDQLLKAMTLKDAVDAQIMYKQRDLFILHDSEMLENFDITELKALMTSGMDFETLQYEAMASLGANFVELLQGMPSILKGIGIRAEAVSPTTLIANGYFGTVIELIDVKTEFRALLRPLNDFLATHLVRDIGLAWRLRDAVKQLEVFGEVSVICLDDYEPEEEEIRLPEGTERLSEFIELKPTSRVASDEALCARIRTVIANELRCYLFIKGDAAVTRESAQSLLTNTKWKLLRFVTQDGTCLSLNEDSGQRNSAPDQERPIEAYESLCKYWDNLRSQINDRERDLERLELARVNCEAERSELMATNAHMVDEIANIQYKVNALFSDRRFLASRISEIDSDIGELRGKIIELRQERSHDGRASQGAAMNDQLKRLDTHIDNIIQEKRQLNSSISELTVSLARHRIDGTRDDLSRESLNDLKCQVSILESEINTVEDFLEMIHDEDMDAEEDGETETPSQQRSRENDAGFHESELTNLRTTIFLLNRKLGLVEKKIKSDGNVGAPPNWIFGRNYADEFEKIKDRSGTGASLILDGTLRRRLRLSEERAPQTFSVTDQAMETLRRVFDVSREEALLTDLGTEALKSMVERFRENFLELAPRGEVQVVDPVQGSSGQQIDGQGETVIKVSFNTAVSDLRIPKHLSGGETSIFNISISLSPAGLSPPRVIILDEVDAPFDHSTQSRFEKFINNLRGGCQVFIVSHKAPHDSLKVDRRISIKTDPRMSRCPRISSPLA